MHTCLHFIKLSREICYAFLIETLINFIFKCCFGNCFKVVLESESQSQRTTKSIAISSPWFFNKNNTYR